METKTQYTDNETIRFFIGERFAFMASYAINFNAMTAKRDFNRRLLNEDSFLFKTNYSPKLLCKYV